jgi:hypothetical protein
LATFNEYVVSVSLVASLSLTFNDFKLLSLLPSPVFGLAGVVGFGDGDGLVVGFGLGLGLGEGLGDGLGDGAGAVTLTFILYVVVNSSPSKVATSVNLTVIVAVPADLAVTVTYAAPPSTHTELVETVATPVFDDDISTLPAELFGIIENEAEPPGLKLIFVVDTFIDPAANT